MLRYAEFCAGVGGFTIGIKQSKLKAELVYCNEIDENCKKTFFKNFNYKVDSSDIFSIVPTSLPDFDLLCSGFPCQPFSQAGKTLGFADPRGTVFFKLMEIIKAKKPAVLFFENVPNLLNHDRKKTFRFIYDCLKAENYNVFTKVLNSTYFGVPQSRPRVYIICLNRNIFGDKKFCFTEKVTAKTALRKFLSLGDFSIPISEKWQEYIDLYTNAKKAKEITFKIPKTRTTLERISENCDLNDCIFQIRSSGIRAYSLDEPFPTFAVSNSGGGAMIPVLSKERRHINLTEMKRLMGFPECFEFPVSRTDSIKQLANAVCPPVITSICNDLNKIMRDII